MDAKNITQAGLVKWLRRFGERLLASSAPNDELAARMVQLGELGVGEVGDVARDIGMRLLRRNQGEPVREDEGQNGEVTTPIVQERLNNSAYLANEYSKLAIQYYEIGNYTAVLNCLDKALTFNANDHRVWSNRGAVLDNLGRYEEAITSFDKAIEIERNYHEAWNNRGLALGAIGRYEEAIASFDKAIEIKPDLHEAWNNRVNPLAKLRRYEEAITSCDKAIEIKPDFHEALLNRGFVLYNLGQHHDAIACCDKAIEIKPDDYDTWLKRGVVLDKLGRYHEAIASYDKAIEIKPDFHEAWLNRGFVLDNLGQHHDAIASSDKAIEIKPDFHEAWYNRGVALDNLGRIEDAITSYDKAIEIKPDHYEVWFKRGLDLINLEQYEEAIASLDKAVEIAPDDHEAWYNRGVALNNLGRHEEEIASYDKAIEIKPDYYNAWVNRGIALARLGQYNDAIASSDKAIEIKPDLHQAWGNRAFALFYLGRHEEEIASYDKALEIKPDFYEAWYNRGNAAQQSVSCDLLLASVSTIAKQNPNLNQRGFEGQLASLEEGLKYCQQDSHPKDWGLLHRAIGDAYYFRGEGKSNYLEYCHKAVAEYRQALITLTKEAFSELHLMVLQNLIPLLFGLGQDNEAKQWQRDGLEVFGELLNSKKSSYQKRQLAVQFISFSQMRVDVLVEDGEFVLALEAAERNKNSYLTWILDAQKQDILSPSYAEMQQLTNPTTAVVYWHLSPFALSTFIIKHNVPQPSVISTPSFLQEFESWVKQWNQQYEDYHKSNDKQVEQQNNWRDNLPQMLKQLSDILNISAILTEINNEFIQNLILLPHRDLHRFPLHALFPDHFTTTYLPSAQVGIFLQQISSTSNGEVHQLLSVEHPDSAGFDILPHAEIESAAINQLFNHPNNKRISDEQATKIAVKEALAAQYNIFHFTGHGSYDFQHPKQSALALSGEDKLTVEEICNIDFRGYRLVTLAACETALTGNQTIENQYVGLVSAFVYQGVTNVLSTLWTVNDDASSLLIMYFYWQLKKGKSPAIALAKAKKWFRNLTDYKLERLYKVIFKKLPRDEKPLRPHVKNKLWEFRHMELADKKQKHFDDPYYWAAFTITGCFPRASFPT
ncbi:CHAT domain-containing protein [Scytonema sp. PRP1]|uniref:CHAT domain-containing protein n=1 Tax=Scytonema sp. PRP1 TaxID=3120513 RepID=UPI002FD48ED9